MMKQLKLYRTVLGTIAAMLILLFVHYTFDYKFPPTFMILFVMFAAFYEGVVSTILCAVLVWLYYAYYFSIPGHLFNFNDGEGERFLISGFVLAATMAMGFILRNRSLAGLQKALDKLKASDERMKLLMSELEDRVKQRTSELAERNLQLATANRLKDEFLATVSHELRTPLNVMQGHSELLLARFKFEPQVTESLNAIYRNAKSQGHIINDLLDVSRIITGKIKLTPSNVDLREVIRSAADSISIAAKAKNINIVQKTTANETHVVADFDRLQQVLWNLLTNAVKFTPNDGTITVELSRVDSQLVMSVSDTGIGIEASFLPYVFDRFRQEDASTTRKHGGLGLGMAIARHITELHGGEIEAFSKGKNLGSTFKITLPVLHELQSHLPNTTSYKEPSGQNRVMPELVGKHILVVDDQKDTLTLVRILLESAGATVTAALSAEEALRAKENKTFDLLLSDIGMPGEDGYSLVKKFADVPSIALTAYASEEDRNRALSAGFKRHLTKPIHGPQLLATIKEVLSLT